MAAAPGQQPATSARLFDRMLACGVAAAGFARWGLEPDARAGLLLLLDQDLAMLGLPATHLLDGRVFAAQVQPFARVMVAGRWVALDGAARSARYRTAMQVLWGD